MKHTLVCQNYAKSHRFVFAKIVNFVFYYIDQKLNFLMTFCSLIGAVIIVIGFYAVLWGKSIEENKIVKGVENLESSCHNVPLLQNRT